MDESDGKAPSSKASLSAGVHLPPIPGAAGETRKQSGGPDLKHATERTHHSAKQRANFSGSTIGGRKLSIPPGEGARNEPGGELEIQLTNDKLQRLQGIFEEADVDGGGGLDMEEFRKAMRLTMGGQITDRELDMLFMKVDTNCDGTVDWDEYLTYMLLECREKDVMNVEAKEPFPRQVRTVKADHRDSINRIHFLPTVAKGCHVNHETGVVDDANGRYLALSMEGVLSFWTKDWHHIYSRRIEPTSPKGKSVWVTDMTCMPLSHVVVVSTTNRDIVFYDISSNRFDKLSRITALRACCMCMKFYTTAVRGTDSQLLWGDDKGGITVLKFALPLIKTQLNPKRFKNGRARFPFEELAAGLIEHIEVIHLPDIHGDVVRQLTVSEHLGCFISCSKDPESAMFVGDIEQKAMQYYFKADRGINAFEYSKKLNIIATGGYDTVVRVWNPYVPVNPIILLAGHKSPILCVHISSLREHVISVAENKEIRIHDLNSQTCIQTFFRKMVPDIGSRHVTASYFHPRRQALVFATTQFVILENRAEDMEHRQLLSHSSAVTVVRYNPLFHQIVSGSVDSQVCVWNIYTGEKVMQFTAHKIRKNGCIINVEVTAMNFDPTYRRLLTAMRDGTVKVWNFNNGACLRELPLCDKGKEITSIICPESRFITAGWNKRLTIYIDDVEDDTTKWLEPSHQEDILCVALLPPNTIASAAYDGVICLWSLDTCRLLMSTKIPDTSQIILPMHTNWEQHRYSASESETHIAANSNNDSFILDDEFCDPTARVKHVAVEKMLFLPERGIHPDTAGLFVACGDGYVRAWSIHHKGHMKGQFLAAHRTGEPVTSMVATSDNEWLITGDCLGYVKVWDISRYCIQNVDDSLADPSREAIWRKFPCHAMLRPDMEKMNTRRRAVITGSYGDIKLAGVRPPKMVNSFRSHVAGVDSLDIAVIEGTVFIVTASTDCSVRLWTLYGESLGILGQPSLWSARKKPGTEDLEVGFPTNQVDPANLSNKGCLLPPDIRRVASACTLRVLNGGRHPMWALARNILMWFGRFSLLSKSTDDMEITEEDNDHSFNQHAIEVTLDHRPCEKVTELGKSYKRSTKHRPMPTLEAPRATAATQFPAYHYLPFAELDNDRSLATDGLDREVMLDIQKRYNLPSLFPRKKLSMFQKIGWAATMFAGSKPERGSKATRKRNTYGREHSDSIAKPNNAQRRPHKLTSQRRRTSIFSSSAEEPEKEHAERKADNEEGERKVRISEAEKDKLGTITEK